MEESRQMIDGELGDSIVMLEQILEVLPQDLVALKGLYNAYCQCGHRERAFEYLGLLADVACDCNDSDTVEFIVEQLRTFEQEFPSETAAQLAQIRMLVKSSTSAPERVVAASSEGTVELQTEADIGEELALAWRLYEENQLTQEEYSSVLHDLTEVSSKELDVPASVLHVLNDRGFSQLNRIMNYLSTRSGVPCLSLINFEISEQVSDVLPLDMSVHDGALPFGFFGNDLLVAVLNPFNNHLVDKVETVSGHRCHTYLVSAEEYDATLSQLRGLAV